MRAIATQALVRPGNGNQQIGFPAAAGGDQVAAAIDQILVPGVDAGLGIIVDIAALNDEAQALAGGKGGARGPDFDVQRHESAMNQFRLADMGKHPRSQALVLDGLQVLVDAGVLRIVAVLDRDVTADA